MCPVTLVASGGFLWAPPACGGLWAPGAWLWGCVLPLWVVPLLLCCGAQVHSVGNFSSSSSLWLCSSRMSIIFLLFWFPGFMQVKLFFWAVVYYSLPLLLVAALCAVQKMMPCLWCAWQKLSQFYQQNSFNSSITTIITNCTNPFDSSLFTSSPVLCTCCSFFLIFNERGAVLWCGFSCSRNKQIFLLLSAQSCRPSSWPVLITV